MPEYKSNKLGRPLVKIVLGSFPKYVVMLSERNPIKYYFPRTVKIISMNHSIYCLLLLLFKTCTVSSVVEKKTNKLAHFFSLQFSCTTFCLSVSLEVSSCHVPMMLLKSN